MPPSNSSAARDSRKANARRAPYPEAGPSKPSAFRPDPRYSFFDMPPFGHSHPPPAADGYVRQSTAQPYPHYRPVTPSAVPRFAGAGHHPRHSIETPQLRHPPPPHGGFLSEPAFGRDRPWMGSYYPSPHPQLSSPLFRPPPPMRLPTTSLSSHAFMNPSYGPRSGDHYRATTVQPPELKPKISRRDIDFLLHGRRRPKKEAQPELLPKEEDEESNVGVAARQEPAPSVRRQTSLDVEQSEHHLEPDEVGASSSADLAAEAPVACADRSITSGLSNSGNSPLPSSSPSEPPRDSTPAQRSERDTDPTELSPDLARGPSPTLAAPASMQPVEPSSVQMGEPSSVQVGEPSSLPAPSSKPSGQGPIRLKDWSIRVSAIPHLTIPIVSAVCAELGVSRRHVASLAFWISVRGTRRCAEGSTRIDPSTGEPRKEENWRTNVISTLADPAFTEDGALRVQSCKGSIYELEGAHDQTRSEEEFLDYWRKLRVRLGLPQDEPEGCSDEVLDRWHEVVRGSFEEGWVGRVAKFVLALREKSNRAQLSQMPRLAARLAKQAKIGGAEKPDLGDVTIGPASNKATSFTSHGDPINPKRPAKRARFVPDPHSELDAPQDMDKAEDKRQRQAAVSHAQENADATAIENLLAEDAEEAQARPRKSAKGKERSQEEADQMASGDRNNKDGDSDDGIQFIASRFRDSPRMEITVEVPARASVESARAKRAPSQSPVRRSKGRPARSPAETTPSTFTLPDMGSAASALGSSQRGRTSPTAGASPSASAPEAAMPTALAIQVKEEVNTDLPSALGGKKISRELKGLISGPFGADRAATRGFLEGSRHNPIVLDSDPPHDGGRVGTDAGAEGAGPSRAPGSVGPAAGQDWAAAGPSTGNGTSAGVVAGAGVGARTVRVRQATAKRRIQLWKWNPVTSQMKKEQSVRRRSDKIPKGAKKTRAGPPSGADGGAREDRADPETGTATASGSAPGSASVTAAAAAAAVRPAGRDDPMNTEGGASRVEEVAAATLSNGSHRTSRPTASGPETLSVRQLARAKPQKPPKPFGASSTRKAKLPGGGASAIGKAKTAGDGSKPRRVAREKGQDAKKKTVTKRKEVAAAEANAKTVASDEDGEWEDVVDNTGGKDGPSEERTAAEEDDSFLDSFMTIRGGERGTDATYYGVARNGDDYTFSDLE